MLNEFDILLVGGVVSGPSSGDRRVSAEPEQSIKSQKLDPMPCEVGPWWMSLAGFVRTVVKSSSSSKLPLAVEVLSVHGLAMLPSACLAFPSGVYMHLAQGVDKPCSV